MSPGDRSVPPAAAQAAGPAASVPSLSKLSAALGPLPKLDSKGASPREHPVAVAASSSATHVVSPSTLVGAPSPFATPRGRVDELAASDRPSGWLSDGSSNNRNKHQQPPQASPMPRRDPGLCVVFDNTSFSSSENGGAPLSARKPPMRLPPSTAVASAAVPSLPSFSTETSSSVYPSSAAATTVSPTAPSLFDTGLRSSINNHSIRPSPRRDDAAGHPAVQSGEETSAANTTVERKEKKSKKPKNREQLSSGHESSSVSVMLLGQIGAFFRLRSTVINTEVRGMSTFLASVPSASLSLSPLWPPVELASR